ncbi:MAG: conjugal transfer protein TraJ [Desulfovibrionaceae bacterium]|nr:conjugal transfer protein TraJ [Desulfovibrionaceae bacterium]
MPSKKLIVKTYLTPEEFDEIQTSANRAGLSLSSFCKRVCLGFAVPSLEHHEARMELRRLKGDLGRLGGLIKQALANGADRQTVHRLLHELDSRQREVGIALRQIEHP